MSKPREIPWDADEHTKVKHDLYRRYLSKWAPIMMHGWKGNITYAEGFSGPGVYKDGAPGSPVIALRSILDHEDLRRQVARTRMRFVFIDREQRCIDLLRNEVTKAVTPVALSDLAAHGFDVMIRKGDCDPDLVASLTASGAWGRPILAVLDSWGGAVPVDLIAKIAENPGSEVIITMQPQYFSRFAGTDDIEHGDKVFGGREWRAAAAQESEVKGRWLLEHYRETVQKAGFDFVLDFELIDARGHALYLVYGTRHDKGLKKMKEAMWEVDAVRGAGYRDPRDPSQETLDIQFEPSTAPLRRLLGKHLESLDSRSATVINLRRFALYRTVYKESQVMPVVSEMLEAGALVRVDSADRPLRFTDTVRLPSGSA